MALDCTQNLSIDQAMVGTKRKVLGPPVQVVSWQTKVTTRGLRTKTVNVNRVTASPVHRRTPRRGTPARVNGSPFPERHPDGDGIPFDAYIPAKHSKASRQCVPSILC